MVTFLQVLLIDIEPLNRADLKEEKFLALENSVDSFEYQVNQCSDQNAVALSSKTYPYVVINGRHRIFLARQKGWKSIRARFV